jgi:hypothetical protein
MNEGCRKISAAILNDRGFHGIFTEWVLIRFVSIRLHRLFALDETGLLPLLSILRFPLSVDRPGLRPFHSTVP